MQTMKLESPVKTFLNTLLGGIWKEAKMQQKRTIDNSDADGDEPEEVQQFH